MKTKTVELTRSKLLGFRLSQTGDLVISGKAGNKPSDITMISGKAGIKPGKPGNNGVT